MLSIHFLLIILLIVIFESCALTCLKNYNKTQSTIFFLFALLFYIVVCNLLNKSFNENGMAIVNIVWSGLSVLATTLIGVFYFKEDLHTHDYLAILLISIGMIILKTTK